MLLRSKRPLLSVRERAALAQLPLSCNRCCLARRTLLLCDRSLTRCQRCLAACHLLLRRLKQPRLQLQLSARAHLCHLDFAHKLVPAWRPPGSR